ncbi:WxL protein peptidoglycan domain-containing protein [Bacillus altitudinis]|uniref:WxL protein peptidoglycan domain-containing protein n=1 Tax=Bacillus altitudinis TaxID=293387 RepID=UPI00228077AB|nr:DUF916 domain-containing protein [Bacillus altitudinis]MCY7454341.1 DUF916 and DUF3324 domain-containing protein [Bacillus altitudinis]
MKKFLLLTLAIFLLTLLNPYFSQAAHAKTDLVFQNLYDDNQLKNNTSYFDLRVNPGQQYKIRIKISNYSNKQKTVLMSTVDATSTQTGILYKKSSEPYVKTNAQFSKMATVTNKITLKPSTSKVVIVNINVGNKQSGQILGGLQLHDSDKAFSSSNNKNTNVEYKTTTTIPISLRLNKPNKEEISFEKVHFFNNKERGFIKLNVINNRTGILNDNDLKYALHKDGHDGDLFKGALNPFQMAPQSSFPLYIKWAHRDLKAGNYTLNINSNGKVHEYKFQISNEDITKYANDVGVNPEITLSIYWIGIVIFLLIVIILILLFKRKKQDKDENKK